MDGDANTDSRRRKKVANFIKKGLQQEGYAADIAQDGEEALESAMAFDYDAMVLDIMLAQKIRASTSCDPFGRLSQSLPFLS